ncbi:MAG: lipoyl(octanoyl) transferase LipB [Bdellovibrionales bacterium]
MQIEDWGLIHYEEANRRQLETVDAVAAGAEERLVLCQHPPVVTLGRSSAPEDLIGWQGETYEVSRGGRATYHGPGQLVIYPILNLQAERAKFRPRDLHSYLRALETATVKALHMAGLTTAEVRTTNQGGLSLTGVWIGERKIASIGIAVRKWVSYHGVAINVLEDPSAFSGINPCGFSSSIMTSVAHELGPTDLEGFKAGAAHTFAAELA